MTIDVSRRDTRPKPRPPAPRPTHGVGQRTAERGVPQDQGRDQGPALLLQGIRSAAKASTSSIYDRRVTAFIGPSGCGKSTLLRILNRIYDLYPGQRATGEVLVDGKDILDARQDLNLLRARVGMVFQKPTPFPMSIYDNIAFGIRLYESLSAQRARRARRAGAAPRRALGRGQGQAEAERPLAVGRPAAASLHRARVAVKPEILLLDEPCSALDPLSTQRVEELIAELKSDYTIAIVTHNMQQAARSSDYTAFMYLGQLIEFDETEAIFTHPKERRPRITSPAGSAELRA